MHFLSHELELVFTFIAGGYLSRPSVSIENDSVMRNILKHFEPYTLTFNKVFVDVSDGLTRFLGYERLITLMKT